MFCIIAFGVLAVMGIFSATNRSLAREALDCVLRRVTFRPCTTGFDEKMKAKILGAVIMRSERAASFINKYFEILSWTFFIIFLASSIWAARGIYLFYTTGSCNGLNQSAFCVFDPKGENNQVSAVEACKIPTTTVTGLNLQSVDLALFPARNPEAKDKIVMVGCYACDYTRKTYPLIQSLVEKSGASFYYLDYPVKTKTNYLNKLSYCVYQEDPQKYWQLNEILFKADKTTMEEEAFARESLSSLEMDADKIIACVNDPQTEAATKVQMDQIITTNFYGTPTIFINGEYLVGPKPYRVYAIMLQGLLYWLK